MVIIGAIPFSSMSMFNFANPGITLDTSTAARVRVGLEGWGFVCRTQAPYHSSCAAANLTKRKSSRTLLS